ncbi:MAG: cation-efflux pump [Anaerolineae bacterium]
MSDSELATQQTGATRDKNMAALTSVLAAVFLTGMKLVIGVLTGSLGILAEAAHSALDLVAAVVTLVAVRMSGRPADREHTYGHGKIENLSALFETFLLLVTCIWIIYEAINRLFFHEQQVEASLWAFAIMGISIVIDYSRSRVLYRAARKYDSQALEADALHFSTDIWSSSVVIGGLALVAAARWLNLPWLTKADAVAAMGVAGIVIYVSFQLGQRTVAALIDGVPTGMRDEIMHRIGEIAGVQEVERVRVRHSGPEVFADVTLKIGRDTPFEHAHTIATQAETAVRQVLPKADVVVQVNPVKLLDEGILPNVRVQAARHGLGAHAIRLYEGQNLHSLEMHLEVPDSLTVDEAHARADAFEKELRQTLPEIQDVVTHIEPLGEASAAVSAKAANEEQVMRVLEKLPQELGVDFQPHAVRMHYSDGQVSIAFHSVVAPQTSITDAHALTERIEQSLRTQLPALGRVVIHIEPSREECEKVPV